MDKRHFILSIKPHYASKIIDGIKPIELRRKFPIKGAEGSIAFVYSSSPVQSIIGYVTIEKVYRLTIEEIWKQFGEMACVERSFFDKYFEGLDYGFAISLEKPVEFADAITIRELEESYDFSPPQSYRYASEKIAGFAGV